MGEREREPSILRSIILFLTSSLNTQKFTNKYSNTQHNVLCVEGPVLLPVNNSLSLIIHLFIGRIKQTDILYLLRCICMEVKKIAMGT